MKYSYFMMQLLTVSSSVLKNNKINTSNKICKDCIYFIANEK